MKTFALLLVLAGFGSQDSGRELFQRGLDSAQAGNLEQARTLFAKAHVLVPSWGLPLLHQALTENALMPGSTDALRHARKAHTLMPNNPRAAWVLGDMLLRAGDARRAMDPLSHAITLRPRYAPALFSIARAQEETGDNESAVANLKQLLSVSPSHTGGWQALARLHEKLGHWEEAENALRMVANANRASVYHVYQLARFFERTGQRHKAQRAHRRAERLDPTRSRRMRKLRASRK